MIAILSNRIISLISFSSILFSLLRPDIQTHVVMVGAELAEISSKTYGDAQRIAEIMLRIIFFARRLRTQGLAVKEWDKTSKNKSDQIAVSHSWMQVA